MRNYITVLLIISAAFSISCSSVNPKNTGLVQNAENNSVDPNQIAATNFIIDGKRFEIQGNYAEAASNYQKCIQKDPKNHTAYYLLSQLYTRRDINQSVNFGKKAIELNPSEIAYHENLLFLYKSQKDYVGAEIVLKDMIKLEPQKKEHYFDLANMFIYQTEYDKALNTYIDFETKFGFEEGVSMQRKQIYLNQKKFNKAAEEIEKLIAKNPKSIEYYGMAADVYQAMGETDKAFSYYSKILEINPNDGKVHLAFADYYLLKGKKEESFRELKIAMGSSELNIDSKIAVMLSYLEKSKLDSIKKRESFELLSILNKTNPNEPKAIAMKADFYNQVGNYPEARKAFRQVIEFDSTKYLIWEQLLLIDKELGDFPSLESESKRALNLFPQYSIIYFFNALANFKLGNYKDAEESIEIGKSFCYSPRQQADFLVLLGQLNMISKKIADTEKYFNEALKLDPKCSSAFRGKASLSILNNEDEKIILDYYKTALQLDSLDMENWLVIIHFLYSKNQFNEALSITQKAKIIGPYHSDINNLEGDILLALNKKQQAISSWKKAMELGSYKSKEIQLKIKQNDN